MSVAILSDYIKQSKSISPTEKNDRMKRLKLSNYEVKKINDYTERNTGSDEFPLLWDEEKK